MRRRSLRSNSTRISMGACSMQGRRRGRGTVMIFLGWQPLGSSKLITLLAMRDSRSRLVSMVNKNVGLRIKFRREKLKRSGKRQPLRIHNPLNVSTITQYLIHMEILVSLGTIIILILVANMMEMASYLQRHAVFAEVD